MLAFTNSKEKQSPTIIGAGCHVEGNIKTDHMVQIHGAVKGNISAETIVIGRGGSVTGDIHTQTLFLHGKLQGDAAVNVANMFSNAQMVGTLYYKTLNVTNNTGLECKLARKKDERK
jgi:cytoskeletal protein CcmA (bactofilin family)